MVPEEAGPGLLHIYHPGLSSPWTANIRMAPDDVSIFRVTPRLLFPGAHDPVVVDGRNLDEVTQVLIPTEMGDRQVPFTQTPSSITFYVPDWDLAPGEVKVTGPFGTREAPFESPIARTSTAGIFTQGREAYAVPGARGYINAFHLADSATGVFSRLNVATQTWEETRIGMAGRQLVGLVPGYPLIVFQNAGRRVLEIVRGDAYDLNLECEYTSWVTSNYQQVFASRDAPRVFVQSGGTELAVVDLDASLQSGRCEITSGLPYFWDIYADATGIFANGDGVIRRLDVFNGQVRLGEQVLPGLSSSRAVYWTKANGEIYAERMDGGWGYIGSAVSFREVWHSRQSWAQRVARHRTTGSGLSVSGYQGTLVVFDVASERLLFDGRFEPYRGTSGVPTLVDLTEDVFYLQRPTSGLSRTYLRVEIVRP